MRPHFGLSLVACEDLVKGLVLVVRNVFLRTSPHGRVSVQQLPIKRGDFLCLGLLFRRFFFLVVVDFQVLFRVGIRYFVFVIFDLDFHRGHCFQGNGMRHKFGIAFGEFGNLVLVGILQTIFLEEERDFGTPRQGASPGIFVNDEFRRSVGRRPNVLGGGAVVLAGHLDAIGHQKGTVKTDPELTNLRNVSRIFFRTFRL
mmetsp:Transcript_17943/g.36977  ORF Transcript_17943/g.36977 Transcript_17943/m.36977 type:complete len:200 (-) Transcript_17943:529-1128(-)